MVLGDISLPENNQGMEILYYNLMLYICGVFYFELFFNVFPCLRGSCTLLAIVLTSKLTEKAAYKAHRTFSRIGNLSSMHYR